MHIPINVFIATSCALRYTIRGSCNRSNGRLAFAKQYIRGTGDWRENKGHKVDYQGIVQGSLAAGGMLECPPVRM